MQLRRFDEVYDNIRLDRALYVQIERKARNCARVAVAEVNRICLIQFVEHKDEKEKRNKTDADHEIRIADVSEKFSRTRVLSGGIIYVNFLRL